MELRTFLQHGAADGVWKHFREGLFTVHYQTMVLISVSLCLQELKLVLAAAAF